MRIAFCIVLALLGIRLVAQPVQLATCQATCSCLTIGQSVLQNVLEAYPQAALVDSASERSRMLREFGYADSVGAIADEIKLYTIAECTVYDSATDNGFVVAVYYVRNVVKDRTDRDENIYVATVRGDTVLGKALIAMLQVDCENTLIRGCTLQKDGTILLQQIRHDFDCSSEEFIKSEKLPGSRVRVNVDGSVSIDEVDR